MAQREEKVKKPSKSVKEKKKKIESKKPIKDLTINKKESSL